jgi:prepilin-type N-terminal cleavage/methylation domain-containing protein
MKLKHAFTLIELLIVVAIIAILAAIAVPNFLEAQTRAKVARVKNDLRSVATAVEAYRVDTNKYPDQEVWGGSGFLSKVIRLTTPIAYITSVQLTDPFTPPSHMDPPEPNVFVSYHFVNYQGYWGGPSCWNFPSQMGKQIVVINSFGPNRRPDWSEFAPYAFEKERSFHMNIGNWDILVYPDSIYDATNGTKSIGDLLRVMGETSMPQSAGGGS